MRVVTGWKLRETGSGGRKGTGQGLNLTEEADLNRETETGVDMKYLTEDRTIQIEDIPMIGWTDLTIMTGAMVGMTGLGEVLDRNQIEMRCLTGWKDSDRSLIIEVLVRKVWIGLAMLVLVEVLVQIAVIEALEAHCIVVVEGLGVLCTAVNSL